jgi:hypothetical protein
LDSDSISIRTCSLDLLLEFTRRTYPGNPNLARIAYPNFIRAPYPSLTQLHQCLPSLIHSCLAELPYPILLPIRLLLTRPYMVLTDRITYLIFSRSDFHIPDRTRPPYPTSLPSWVTLRCIQLLTQPYPITFPGWLPFNWPHLKTSSSASNPDLCLFWMIMHQDSSGNPKPTFVTLKHPE